MSGRNLAPALIAAGVGVLGGIYIWQAPLQELSGKTPAPSAPTDGRGQAAKDVQDKGIASVSPHTPLKYGGASPNDPTKPTVAGTTAQSRVSYSADHNPATHDGSGKGGVGVSEMRERKMQGQGLPSKQGGDSPAKATDAVLHEGEGGGIKKQGRWWLGGW